MALAAWKDLCVDVVDPVVMGPFWSVALGLDLHVRERDGMHHLTGPTPQHTVWLNPVPEPVTVKQRVHLDVHVGSVDELLALGATPWTSSRSGGRCCAIPRVASCARSRGPRPRCRRTASTSWVSMARGPARSRNGGGRCWTSPRAITTASTTWSRCPGCRSSRSCSWRSPSPRRSRTALHWDVTTDDVARLVRHGATVLRVPDGEIAWTVLADPEGNEFCAFQE